MASSFIVIANQVADLIPVKNVTALFGGSTKTSKMMASVLLGESVNIHAAANWRQNTKALSLTSATEVSEFALPADFDQIIDDTVWLEIAARKVRTINEARFSYLSYSIVNGASSLDNYFMVSRSGDTYKLTFLYPVKANEVVRLFYKTHITCLSNTDIEKESPTSDTDKSIYSDGLIRAALHKGMLLNLGMDAQYPIAEYSRLLQLEIAHNSDNDTISLSPISSYKTNIPESGFGT